MSSNDPSHQQPHIIGHRKHPCVLCQQRKVKCDRNEPCANCTKAGVECIAASALQPRKRKRRFPEAELLARLRRYEHHLKRYGADIDAINREGSQDGKSYILATRSAIRSGHSDLLAPVDSLSPEPFAARTPSVRRSLRHVDNNLDLGVSNELRDAEELLQGSSEDEMFANPITKTYEDIGGDGDDFVLGSQATERLTSLHPSPVNIFRLWQIFLDNINPLIKIFHAPSVQQRVLDAAADLDEIPRNTEALMFGIYAVATLSMDDNDCQKLFRENKKAIVIRFQSGARRALCNAGYLKSSDIVVLQAFALYLLSSLQMTIDPRSLFCLTGVAIRIAQRMGLSTDGTNYAIPPFEAEMRRRLWWQLVLIDNRVAELSGAGTSMLTYGWSTRLPANTNDSDLFPDMRDPPMERPGLTEMIFVRLRCDIARFFQQARTVVGSPTVEEGAIESLEQRLEREYLDYCDPLIPLHFMSSMMAKSAFCKLRMGLLHPHFMSNQINDLPQAEKDKMFQLSLRMLEVHNATMKNPSVQRYVWHVYTNFPFPAHVHLLCALRYRTNDELAERAWQQLSESVEARMKCENTHFFAKKKNNFLHYALGNMTVKAWEARESALQSRVQAVPIPHFVSEYRERLAERKSKIRTAASETSRMLKTDPALGGVAARSPALDPDSVSMEREFDQLMLPGMLPTDLPPTGWEFWNDMMQGSDSMLGIDVVPPPYTYHHS